MSAAVEQTVFIIDDEPDVRDALRLLVRSAGYHAEALASAREFLVGYRPSQQGCLVLDVRMPEMTGLELQQELKWRGIDIPIVFISGHGDIPMAVRAVQAGAVDFLEKPFNDDDLLERIQRALARDREQHEQAADRSDVAARLAQLTPRERDVLTLLLEGAVNKIVARELDLSVRTVELHRAHILAKMSVDNVPQLIRLVLGSGIALEPAAPAGPADRPWPPGPGRRQP